MLQLDEAAGSICLWDIFVTWRVFAASGVTDFRVWNRTTSDWEAHSYNDYISVSATENHTLLIRFPDVGTLMSWPETMSQAYAPCQTIDPRAPPSRKGKERAYE